MPDGFKWKTVTAQQLADAFVGASKDARDDAFAVLRTETYAMRDISVAQTPVDKGNLEDAQQVVIRRNQSDKATYEIVVGGVVDGVDVDAYAMQIHEGSYNLGPKSILKNATSPYTVGPKFLERAFDGRIELTLKRLYDAVVQRMQSYVG